MSLETKDVVAAIKRRPFFTACAAVAVTLGLLTYFRLGLGDEVQAQLEQREKELTRLSNNVKFSAQLDTQLQTLRKANETIAAGALRAGELARNQQLFYRLEAESGVKLLDLRQIPVPPPAKGAPAGTYAAIPFSLTIKGDYAQLIDFLNRLDRGATLARVTSASISKPSEDAQSVSLNVELLGFRQ